jgi:hypothetical protein
MRKPTRVSVLATVTLVALSVAGYACRPDRRPPTSAASAQQTPSPSAAPSPAYFEDAAAARPSGLRLLSSGWFHDVDRGSQATRRVAVTRWLDRWDRGPVLLDERATGRDFGRFRFSMRREPALPGNPSVTVIDRPALGSVAVADGDDLWVEEYLSASSCSIRRVRPGGRTVQAPRKVPCGTQPLAQTAAGLWLAVGPDAIAAARQSFDSAATKAVLVDPATFAERATYPWVAPFDRHRAIVFTDLATGRMALHDARTDALTPIATPPSYGFKVPDVGLPSPDARWLVFRYAQPGENPQVLDVWLLDLQTLTWAHVPAMPAYGYLKPSSACWAADGRLVVAYRFAVRHDEGRLLLFTWQPGGPLPFSYAYDQPLEGMIVWPA